MIQILLFTRGDVNLGLSILSHLSFSGALFLVGGRVTAVMLFAVAVASPGIWGDPQFTDPFRRFALIVTIFIDVILLLIAPMLLSFTAVVLQYAAGKFLVLQSRRKNNRAGLPLADQPEPTDVQLYKIWNQIRSKVGPTDGLPEAWNARLADIQRANMNLEWTDAVRYFAVTVLLTNVFGWIQTTYPLGPAEEVRLKNDKVLDGYLVQQDDDFYLMINERTRSATTFRASDITTRSICASSTGFPFGPLITLIPGQREGVSERPKCE